MVAPHLGGPLHDPASPVRVIVIGDDRCFGEIDRTGSREDTMRGIIAGLAIAVCSISALWAEEIYDLRAPVGWGNLTASEFCVRTTVPGQSGCEVAPVTLPGDISQDATFFQARGTLKEIESLGDFSPFPWSRTTRKHLYGLSADDLVAIPGHISINSCAVAFVPAECTCADKPLGGMDIVCNEMEHLPFSIPPVPPGQLIPVRGLHGETD